MARIIAQLDKEAAAVVGAVIEIGAHFSASMSQVGAMLKHPIKLCVG
jgi:hypothetical protein